MTDRDRGRDRPAVSVIVPAYDSDSTLPACLQSLLEQAVDFDYEIVLYLSADTAAALPAVPEHPRLRALTSGQRVKAATARNRAIAASRSDLIAFTDADVVADPHWLAGLVAAAGNGSAVAGAVINGTPGCTAGTVQYLLEFLDFHPRRKPAGLWHGATCNLLVPRDLWRQHGPFPEDLEGGEDTLLTVRLHRLGKLVFAPRAAVVHQNRTSVVEVLRHLYALGRKAAHVARRGEYRGRVLVKTTALAPVAGVARAAVLTGKLVRWPVEERTVALRSAPLVLAGLGAWSLGLGREGLRIDRGSGAVSSAAGDWEIEGVVADSLPEGWRRHARAAHVDLVRRWTAGGPQGTWLKSDLQEERTTVRSILPEVGGDWVGIDVASSVVAEAGANGYLGVTADVRRLPFADGAFDGVLSTSTLDHFHAARDIDVALHELRRVVRSGGTLILTLDNPENPLIWLRNRLPAPWRAATGLVPFHVGPTLSAADGEAALRRAGFEVSASEHLLHAPHVLGTRSARWPWFERHALPRFDLLRHTPMARFSGHYVAFRAT